MTKRALKDILKRVESWPEQDQEKLVRMARDIEKQHVEDGELTSEDWEVIEKRIDAGSQAALASEEEVAVFFRKYHRI